MLSERYDRLLIDRERIQPHAKIKVWEIWPNTLEYPDDLDVDPTLRRVFKEAPNLVLLKKP